MVPGHIAKAEQQLRHLDKVDLVIEVRDALPLHRPPPSQPLDQGQAALLVINRRDMVTPRPGRTGRPVQGQGQRTVWCDAKAGQVKQVQQAAIRAGDQLSERRRNVACVPGRCGRSPSLPNVGKSH